MPKTIYSPGEYYHIYNRGVNRQPIFFTEQNWAFFLQRLHKYFTPDKADIIAYCLMPNHYHLLVYIKTEDFGHTIMQPFSTSYTKAINRAQKRVGSLFQGPYKGKWIKNNKLLLHITRYIHRNPVDAGLVYKPADWEYSSYRDYINQRHDGFLKPDIILSQFKSINDYASFVEGGSNIYRELRDAMLG